MQENLMLKASLEEQLRKWREARGSQPTESRTVKVNGQSVVVLQRPRRAVHV